MTAGLETNRRAKACVSAETEVLLNELDIRYDRLTTSEDVENGVREGQSLEDWKVETIHQIALEDMPEIIHRIKSSIQVFMACDAAMREWIRDQIE